MHAKAVVTLPLLVSAAAMAVAPHVQLAQYQSVNPAMPQSGQFAPSAQPYYPNQRISAALSQWNTLRQSDRLPFASYSNFLRGYPGWPGETAMRRTAERAIDLSASPSEVVNYFRQMPPLTGAGHARYAFALLTVGESGRARAEAQQAWLEADLPRADEDRLFGLFGTILTTADHDLRLEALLAARGVADAQRLLPYGSPGRRPIYEARLALQTKASDAGARLATLGSAANTDAALLIDRANWLRDGAQPLSARQLLAEPMAFTAPPVDAEKWLDTLLTYARGAAADRQWTLAYKIASQADKAFAPGTDIATRSTDERDDYTSLVWLAGTTAYRQLGNSADAVTMFARYARGGKSTQVLTKGMYWAGRAAETAGMSPQANAYFAEAAGHPELFYGQLSLERLGRPVPAPVMAGGLPAPTASERSAFAARDLVEATRLLGQMGRWEDQSVFVRALAEQAGKPSDRILVGELSRQIARPDLAVWLARNARNAGSPFYARDTYPEMRIPVTQSRYWSLAHGIMRQESSFDRAAMSPVGARGMMQLMPATARQIARKLSLPYELGRLTRDIDYNIMLGSSYFAELMDYWGGYAPLAVASYNAGPGNVSKWIRSNGDPRQPGTDIVSWIEDIPFTETRGYVQRVLENAVVYDTLNSAQNSPARRISFYLGRANAPG
jgi:soluble lytic murein transglycosylase